MKNDTAKSDGKQLGLAQNVPSLEDLILPPQHEATSRFDDIPNHQLGDDQEFFIPVHDFVRFTEDELQIIDHPSFQRLEKVYQLGLAHLVYRSATHKRLEHVLGTVTMQMPIAIRNSMNFRAEDFLIFHTTPEISKGCYLFPASFSNIMS